MSRIRDAVATLLLAVACTSAPTPSSTTPSLVTPRQVSGFPEPSVTPAPPSGGEAVFGAEQWPECLNPITGCASAPWTWYVVLEHVLPRAMQLDPKGNFVASPLLLEAPSLENGGLTESPFTVRFRLNPTATWDDGSPITSEDFAFTWRAIVSTTGAVRMTGYDRIESIDTTDPAVAVVRFRQPYADWPDLFGGAFGFVLKRAAFLGFSEDHPDLVNEMMGTISFSGGPFTLDRWTRDAAILTRNEHYFGPRALLDRVTFVPETNPAEEFQLLLTGALDAIFPDIQSADLLEYLQTPGPQAKGSDGTRFEALWFRQDTPPLDELLVRQALAFAVDRQAIVDEIVKPVDPDGSVLNCGFIALPHTPWCAVEPFERFSYDPKKAKELLEQAGYDCSATPCSRDGRALVVPYAWNTCLERSAVTFGLLKKPALRAGFELRPENFAGSGGPSRCAFPPANPGVAEYSSDGFVDPSVTRLLACGPLNAVGWCDPEANQLMTEADREPDQERRIELMSQFYEVEADDVIGLPLYVVPTIIVWRADHIDGPIGLFAPTPYGTFFNMNEWRLAS